MTGFRFWAAASMAALTLASCGPNGEYTGLKLENFDPDLRGFGGGGLSTTEAAAAAAPRPQPDQRGVISYPGYQVALARRGDTVRTVADRLGMTADELGRYNALKPDDLLREGEVIALPRRVDAATVMGSAPQSGAIIGGTIAAAPIEVTAIASRSLLQYFDQFQPPASAPEQPRIGP